MAYTKLLENTAAGGTNGTAVTGFVGGNTGGASGDYFNLVTIASGSSLVFSNERPLGGTLSYKARSTGGQSTANWTDRLTGAPHANPSGAMKFRLQADAGAPARSAKVVIFRGYADAAQTTMAFQIGVNPDGTIVVETTTAGVGSFTTTFACADDTDYRIEWEQVTGTSFTVRLFTATGSALLGTQTSNATQWDDPVAAYRFGIVGGGAGMTNHALYFVPEVGTGPGMKTAGANVAPTVTLASSLIVVPKGTPFTFSWTEADSDGTVASRTVTQIEGATVALTSPTTTSRTGTTTVPGVRKYQVVATDNLGAPSAAAVVTVVVTDLTARPIATDSNGGWTAVGAASVEAALADELDTSWIETGDGPANVPVVVDLSPIDVGPVTVNVRADASAATPVETVRAELLQLGVAIAFRLWTVTATKTDFTFTTTATETAALTPEGRRRLQLRLTGNQS